MLRPVVLVNVVGLTPRMVTAETPGLMDLARFGSARPLRGVVPAVTCTAQATLLTGVPPRGHGIVGNGWLHRDTGEVRFWLQCNRLIQSAPVYEIARRRAGERGESFSCAKMFWWFNQGAAVDWSVTPKPHYGCDGSKEFGIYSTPAPLAATLEREFGPFPFHSFWGPRAGLPSSEWIARAAAAVIRAHRPTLTLVYLPHLDYDLQRFGPGPSAAESVRAVDRALQPVVAAARDIAAQVVVVSEYGIAPVTRAVYVNRELRAAGWLESRDGPFGEMLDTFASRAIAVVDHQVAHIYIRDATTQHSANSDETRLLDAIRHRLLALPGVAAVLDREAQASIGLDHERSGELVLLAEPDVWFAYPYWLDDLRAPDFARTVDIHRKPGYDPCELLSDPRLWSPRLRVVRRLIAKKVGLRYRMDLIPLDASLIRGSHGITPSDSADGPILIAPSGAIEPPDDMAGVRDYLLQLMGLPE